MTGTHSNLTRSPASDATFEGWSRALELCDNETEGNTLRVEVLTVNLARLFAGSEGVPWFGHTP